MNATSFSWKILLLLALAAGATNVIPLALTGQTFDNMLHFSLMQCFSEHVWQGYFYPRWCMEANLGRGSPAPIFYFLIPYYAAALFYPLTYAGLGIPDIYLLSNALAGAAGFICCFLWLRTITNIRRALFCSFIFLWMHYRMDVETLRQSYTELWCLSLLPLVFLYVRRIIVAGPEDWPKLALAVAACFLCHAPATIVGLMGAGLLSAIQCAKNPKRLVFLFLGVALGFLTTLFHWIPVKILSASLHESYGGVHFWRMSYVNDYLGVIRSYENPVVLYWLIIITLPMMLGFFLWAWRRRRNINDPVVYKEAAAWLLVTLFAIIMAFPVSDPLWQLIEPLIEVKTPWRMQALIMFAFVYMLAVALEWLLPAGAKKRSGDALLFAAFSVTIGFCTMSSQPPSYLAKLEKRIASQLTLPFFATHGIASGYITEPEEFYRDFPSDAPRAHLLGQGSAEEKQWGYGDIHIAVDAPRAATLRIEQFYFPVWHATLDGKPVEITPESKKGRMLVDIPPGKHDVQLRVVVETTWLPSLAAIALVIASLFRARRNHA